MIKSKLISILFFAFLFCITASLNPETSAAAKETGKLFLWEVRSDKGTVYLLGSIHVFKETLYPLDPAINDAFERSDMLVVEVNTADMNENEMNRIVQQKGMYTGGETLEKNLSKETLKMLHEYLKLRGMELSQVNRMKPWLLNLSIGIWEIQRYGYKQQHGIDLHFIDKAKDNKMILEMETMDEQLTILSDGTKEEHDYSLRLTLDQQPEMRSILYEMINAWTVGNADGLLNIERDSVNKYPELNSHIERILYDRNIKMAGKIKEYLKTGKTYFVVIGALHMGGEKGLVKLLQDEKYEIKQVAKTPKKSILKASTLELPEYLKAIDFASFFPAQYETWILYENSPKDKAYSLKWINDKEHEIELRFKEASRSTIQNIYQALGREFDKALIERGGDLLKLEEYFALAMVNEFNDMISVNLLYGTVNSAYLWKYKVPNALKAGLGSFINKLTFTARKEQYEKALASGNVAVGRWQKQIHEYARLLAEKESPDAETVYTNLLMSAPDRYEAHIEFALFTKDKKRKRESARIVMKDAEDEDLLVKAAEILKIEIPDINSYLLLTNEDKGIRVVLVPLPPVNPWTLDEIAKTYESITTIPVSIRRLSVEWSLPEPSRSDFRPQIERMAATIWPDKTDFSNWSMDKLKEEIMAAAQKEGPASVFMVTGLFKEIETRGGQWLAKPLISKFYEALFPYVEDNKKTMYVGITDASIYADDTNFLYSAYSGPDKPVSILSCARLMAKATGEKQSRRRLIERCAKELVPASLKRLGIPRSTDPSCPYSYANRLERVDEKSLRLSDFAMGYILLERAMLHHEKGEFEQALSGYDKVIELVPEFSEAYSNRGAIYFFRNEFDKAIADYNRAIGINPEDERAINNRGSIYLQIGELDLALLDFDWVITANPENAEAYLGRALLKHRKKEYQASISDYEKAIKIKPGYFEAFNNRGNVYRELGALELAISDYQKAIELNPSEWKAYNSLGIILRDAGKYDQAISYYSKVVELSPDFFQAYNNRGNIYMTRGEYKMAISDYSKVIELNPVDTTAYFNLGLVYYYDNNMEKAIKYYNKAIEINPDYVEAYGNRGAAYNVNGQPDRAIEDYNKALALNPKYTMGYVNRGNIYASKNQFDLAFSDFNKASELDPKHANTYIQRGIAYGRKGDHDLAISDFNRAIEINPKADQPYNNRGYSFLLKGEHEKAIQDFNHSIKLNPAQTLAYINRGNTFYRIKDRVNACNDWKQACMLGACDNFTRAEKAGYCK